MPRTKDFAERLVTKMFVEGKSRLEIVGETGYSERYVGDIFNDLIARSFRRKANIFDTRITQIAEMEKKLFRTISSYKKEPTAEKYKEIDELKMNYSRFLLI